MDDNNMKAAISEVVLYIELSYELYDKWKIHRRGIQQSYFSECYYYEAELLISGLSSQLKKYGRISNVADLDRFTTFKFFTQEIFNKYFICGDDYSLILSTLLLKDEVLRRLLQLNPVLPGVAIGSVK